MTSVRFVHLTKVNHPGSVVVVFHHAVHAAKDVHAAQDVHATQDVHAAKI